MKNVQNVSPCLMAIAVSAGLATPAAAEYAPGEMRTS